MLNRFHNRCVPSFSPGIAAQVEPVRLSPKEGVTYSLFYAMHSKMGVMVLQKIHFTSSSLVSCSSLLTPASPMMRPHLAHTVVPRVTPCLHLARSAAPVPPPPSHHRPVPRLHLAHVAAPTVLEVSFPPQNVSVAASTTSFLKHNGS
jgi:hypothetical protein